jgi:hypothetical protein
MNYSYNIVAGPPSMGWDEYEKRLLQKWREFIDSEEARTESNIQHFLEQHPCLVPGAFVCGDNFDHSGHGPLLNSLISQPPLRALGENIPDFMWMTRNSSVLSPVLVEIETPFKLWFRKDGVPQAAFTQALNQITEWKNWFGDSTNISWFRDYYGIPDNIWRRSYLKPKYILVHGSRKELDGRVDEINKKRSQQERVDEQHMTFDRLKPNFFAYSALCIKAKGNGEYRAIGWPPTAKNGPAFAHDYARISDKKEAARKSEWLSSERKIFLCSRFDYWDDWARTETGSVTYQPSDEE